MTTAAAYNAWLEEVEQALASINMAMEEWQSQWEFDFQREFNAGSTPSDVAMKANTFWAEQKQSHPARLPAFQRLLAAAWPSGAMLACQ
jgi:hypothetical protein